MEAACRDFMRALERCSRGRVRMEIGEATSRQEPEPRTRHALFGEDHVEVPFRIDGAPHVAHFSWESKYSLRVDTALPMVNGALARHALRWMIVESESERGFVLLTEEEINLFRPAFGVWAQDPCDTPC